MGYEIETAQVGAYTVTVEIDNGAGVESPREWDNLGTFYTDHRHYATPDEWDRRGDLWQAIADAAGVELHDGRGADAAFFRRLGKAAIWLPVWIYDHSGVSYAAAKGNPFTCPWDSGAVGVVFVSKADVRAEWKVKRISPALRRKVESVLAGEVDTYSSWASGDVYGWIVQDRHGETVDSRWGYIGESEYCLSEGIRQAEWQVRQDRKSRIAKLKTMIRNRVPLAVRADVLATMPV